MIKNQDDIVIMSIETSGSACSATLSINGCIAAEFSVLGNNLHDKLLAEFISRLQNDLGFSINDLDAVAVSAGPGSFTGLRIGGSIAKALCYEERPRLIGVPTLQALAYSAMKFARALNAGTIIAVVPSHKDLYYYQFFDTGLEPISEIFFREKDEMLKSDKMDIVVCGPGGIEFKQGRISPGTEYLSARITDAYAYKMYKEGLFTPAEEFIPLYVQDFQPKTHRKPL